MALGTFRDYKTTHQKTLAALRERGLVKEWVRR